MEVPSSHALTLGAAVMGMRIVVGDDDDARCTWSEK